MIILSVAASFIIGFGAAYVTARLVVQRRRRILEALSGKPPQRRL